MYAKIEIPLSKKKLILFFFIGLFFIIIGYIGIIKPENFISPFFRNSEIIRIISIAGVLFFGIGIIYILWKLFDKKPGLIIDQKGIIDNSNATSVGLIEWSDINRIEKKQVMSTEFLILHINQPEKYIQRVKNIILKKAIEMNVKKYGSPISITCTSLEITIKELESIIIQEFNKNKI